MVSHWFDKKIELSEVRLLLHVEELLLGWSVLVLRLILEGVALVNLFVKVIQDAVEQDLDIWDVDGCLIKVLACGCQLPIHPLLLPIVEHQEDVLECLEVLLAF